MAPGQALIRSVITPNWGGRHRNLSEASLGISFEEIDRAGVVTLDRPARLNALSREMFEALSAQYRAWAPAPHIYGVVMQSAHPSVFSSGGDLKILHEWSEQGARGAIREFYRGRMVTSGCWRNSSGRTCP